MNTATILGKLEQIKDATKLATKGIKGDELGDARIAVGDILALAADIVSLLDTPAKDITA